MEYLIPQAWFSGLAQWVLLAIAAAAIGALVKGADALVDGASGIAYRLGVSKVIVGATIVSLGTTSPECAVSVLAAWSGESGLALGNAVGSIIVDSGLVFGLGCLLTVLPADRYVLARQGWVQFGAGLLLAGLCYTLFWRHGTQAVLGRGVGFLFLGLLAAYMAVSVRWSRRHPRGEPFQMDGPFHLEVKTARRPVAWLAAAGLGGLVVVLLASRVLICAVSELAEQHWHVPKVVVAATLVAFGTSLPELVIGMASILKGHREILVGNVIGADILNVLFVVGAAAAAAPLPLVETGSTAPRILLYLHLPTMVLVLVLFRLSIQRAMARERFVRWHGLPLLAVYVVYAVVQFAVARGGGSP